MTAAANGLIRPRPAGRPRRALSRRDPARLPRTGASRPQARHAAIHQGGSRAEQGRPAGKVRRHPPRRRQRPELARHHQQPRVGRRTVALALASAEPPERKKIHREPAALNGLHAHIDAMIDDNPAIGTAAIWQRLADDHGATVAYCTLRTYVVSRRAAKPPDKID